MSDMEKAAKDFLQGWQVWGHPTDLRACRKDWTLEAHQENGLFTCSLYRGREHWESEECLSFLDALLTCVNQAERSVRMEHEWLRATKDELCKTQMKS